ncbi:hypothetical protein [Lacticaseibacillus paracasei]|uniref:hypothetical protein n=1 Tax=Lacticaseibacillus paracasei TaxID=1597 RepID=UPI0031EE7428
MQNLNDAFKGLKATPVDISKLQAAYDKNKDLTNTDNKYTAASWTTFQTALTAAQKVLTNSDATQADVDAALQNLNDAFKGLKATPTDTSKLQAVYDKDKSLTNTDHKYTAASWTDFQAALAAVQKVLTNSNTT